MSRSKLFTTIILVVLVTFLTKVDSFLPRAYNKDIQCSSKVMMQSRDSVEPISVQYNVKKASSVLLPFLATLLTTGLVASAAGTGAAGFLTEPTAEFKDEEKKVADFKAQQNKIRKSWDEIIAKLEVSDSPLVTEACIKDLTAVLTKYNSGIPSGVKKLELVKTIRAKKYVMVGKKQKILPTWSKESEIAYQILIQEFNRQVTPNNRVSFLSVCNPLFQVDFFELKTNTIKQNRPYTRRRQGRKHYQDLMKSA